MALDSASPLASRLTLTGLLPFASPSVLHHFACDCAQRALDLQQTFGHSIHPALQDALLEKRLWIEGASSLENLKDAMRSALDATLESIQNNDAVLAWACLSAVEAVYWEAKDAALQAAARSVRSIIMRVLRSKKDGAEEDHAEPPIPPPAGVSRLLFTLWIRERFWQEDHLTSLIHEASLLRGDLLALFRLRQAQLASQWRSWHSLFEESLFDSP